MLGRAMRRRPVARAVVGTAVIAGTAGAVHHHQEKKYAAQDQQAYEAQQYEAQQAQAQYYEEPAPQQVAAPASQVVYAPPPPAAAPAPDMGAQLQNLADLHASGALTDEEYAAAKAKVISG